MKRNSLVWIAGALLIAFVVLKRMERTMAPTGPKAPSGPVVSPIETETGPGSSALQTPGLGGEPMKLPVASPAPKPLPPAEQQVSYLQTNVGASSSCVADFIADPKVSADFLKEEQLQVLDEVGQNYFLCRALESGMGFGAELKTFSSPFDVLQNYRFLAYLAALSAGEKGRAESLCASDPSQKIFLKPGNDVKDYCRRSTNALLGSDRSACGEAASGFNARVANVSKLMCEASIADDPAVCQGAGDSLSVGLCQSRAKLIHAVLHHQYDQCPKMFIGACRIMAGDKSPCNDALVRFAQVTCAAAATGTPVFQRKVQPLKPPKGYKRASGSAAKESEGGQ